MDEWLKHELQQKTIRKSLKIVELKGAHEYHYWIWIEIFTLMALRSWYASNSAGAISNPLQASK